MATYRFFDNDSVDWRDLMAPHWQQTQQRMAARPVNLCLEDTTELDFHGQEAKGLEPLSYKAQRGMYVHPTYAVTPEREPLGILNAWMYACTLKDAHGQRGGPKESLRWIEGYERIAEMAPDLPGTRLVYVADREADTVHPTAKMRIIFTRNIFTPSSLKQLNKTHEVEAIKSHRFHQDGGRRNVFTFRRSRRA